MATIIYPPGGTIDPGAIIGVAGYTRDMHRSWVSTMNPQLCYPTSQLAHAPPPFDPNIVKVYQKP